MSAQLPLGLQLRDSARFDNFLPGPNSGPLAAAQACADGEEPSLLFLWGSAGSGRSHLLQAACRRAAAAGDAVAYLPFGGEAALAPQMLQGLEQADLVCIDDLDRVAGQASWEGALFALVNGLLDRCARLVTAASLPPAECGIALADLRSRLSLSAVFHLQPLDDAEKLAVLQVHAASRGLELNDDAGRYLLHHCQRDMGALLAMLERLDRASLAAQRRLTVPFVREVLAGDRDRK